MSLNLVEISNRIPPNKLFKTARTVSALLSRPLSTITLSDLMELVVITAPQKATALQALQQLITRARATGATVSVLDLLEEPTTAAQLASVVTGMNYDVSFVLPFLDEATHGDAISIITSHANEVEPLLVNVFHKCSSCSVLYSAGTHDARGSVPVECTAVCPTCGKQDAFIWKPSSTE